ncbi:MAG: nitroreductase [Hyphomicrobiaceae bacterium]|jgi:nitroreductase
MRTYGVFGPPQEFPGMQKLFDALNHRFDADLGPPAETIDETATLKSMAARRSHRRFKPEQLSIELLQMLCATALSAPSKSDLQARDIVIVRDKAKHARLAEMVGQEWIPSAPELLVFCGNNKRQRQIHEWRQKPFENDHLDAFFNPAVDAGIAMQAFVTAAESIGLGCCPISGIRNNCDVASEVLELPEHVFPVVGLGVGWPVASGHVSVRLPLEATVHVDTFKDDAIAEQVEAYDNRRYAIHHAANQRQVERFGEVAKYTWSEDKARQYASPERADFGAFVKSKGFLLK